MNLYIYIVFVAFGGFILSVYLHHKKRQKSEQFICPLRGKCSEVIQSNYSKFFGIPVELLGMAYYGLIAVGYGALIGFNVVSVWLAAILLLATTGAFAFSLYLTFVQIAALRKFCTWCLLSASFSTAIFVLAVSGSLELVIPFLDQYHSVFVLIHVLAMALGLGAATLTDVFFFKFLKDYLISEQESAILSTISEFIWFALGLILMSGLALFLPEASTLLETPKFLAKILIVVVIITNGAILNLVLQPKLIKISFHKKHDHKDGELTRARRLAFLLGPISFVSWYTAFILGSLKDVPLELTEILGIYASFLVLGILGGRFIEWHYQNKK
ncbi:vitamin K epoxide reductase family protein [Candidatus Uhrbacteria bacterium]|jgi:uncharacterized membrane protein|nr:vitamin K epoxide reductase family protein [Candidatus Uhrbacteria bacterium]